ncbi:amidohydrolase [Caulobacter sp. Root1455]|uniref:amidohydrolase family protein n=1 Tax=unclassified Caulobacter TaxID=2648921 RepID=UPI0006F7D0DE|nr:MULTISPECIES: amidohydrolase family protein [unclassified Caulobacter]KQY32773.1 amidohydrolase [Caulobacter sp. Root487D2Y]KQZ02747.1 amidohydrolase [Caulobacter sp. Root1455]
MTYLGPIIDPHMHLWDLERHYYSWLQDTPLPNNPAGDMSSIAYRSYGLDDYLADTAGWNVVQTVHVECGLPPKDQLSETDWLQGLADTRGVIGGIVAGANLNDPAVEALLEAHAARATVRGVRQIVNWHRDPAKTYGPADLLLDPQWRKGYALLAKYGLSFDLQLYPSQMAAAAALAAANPEVSVIVNHAGMPTDRDEPGLQAWRDGLALLAQRPNVSCKISGLAMIDRAWTIDSLRPFVLRVIETFGPSRCMFASNFPVEKVHGSFGGFYEAYDTITADFGEAERSLLFEGTAARVYRLPPPNA